MCISSDRQLTTKSSGDKPAGNSPSHGSMRMYGLE
jgi:hypothetical protein